MIRNIKDGNKIIELARVYKESQKLAERGRKDHNNGHREKPGRINRNWLNSLIRRAFSVALTPKLREMKVNRVKVVYRENSGDIARRTLSDRFRLGRRTW